MKEKSNYCGRSGLRFLGVMETLLGCKCFSRRIGLAGPAAYVSPFRSDAPGPLSVPVWDTWDVLRPSRP